jgi:hypothetical protein
MNTFKFEILETIFILWLLFHNATTAVEKIAQYNLNGLPIATTPILSSISPSSQPNLKSPGIHSVLLKYHQSVGDIDPSDYAKDPTLYFQGMHIEHSKYIVVSDKWQENTDLGLYALIWIFNIQGQFGSFVDIDMDVRQI